MCCTAACVLLNRSEPVLITWSSLCLQGPPGPKGAKGSSVSGRGTTNKHLLWHWKKTTICCLRWSISFICHAQGQTGPKGETGTPGPPGPPVSQCPRLFNCTLESSFLYLILSVGHYLFSFIPIDLISVLISHWHLSLLFSPLHNRDLPAMLSTHSPCRLPWRAEFVGTSMPARWWTTQLRMPTTRTTTTAWRKSLARSTPSSWRSSRWSIRWAHRATPLVPARTCSSVTPISPMVCITLVSHLSKNVELKKNALGHCIHVFNGTYPHAIRIWALVCDCYPFQPHPCDTHTLKLYWLDAQRNYPAQLTVSGWKMLIMGNARESTTANLLIKWSVSTKVIFIFFGHFSSKNAKLAPVPAYCLWGFSAFLSIMLQ